MATLRLGNVDKGLTPSEPATFFMKFHATMSKTLRDKMMFRDEGNSSWRNFEEVPGTRITALQKFLKDAGFMPNAAVDGIFGYRTQAAVRLFQEYIRTVEGDPTIINSLGSKATIGTPDGLAGTNTFSFIEDWKNKKNGTPDFKCKWAQFSTSNSSPEFKQWLQLLAKAKGHYLADPHPILQFLEKHTRISDTKKIKDWDMSPNTIHLIGIRRNQETGGNSRVNDDLFVLLINGMVFKFWGSTDPSQSMADLTDEPFLIEGQHLYQFGWHKVSSDMKIYRAMRPAEHGVLVFRDRDNNDALTEKDIKEGLDDEPNKTINIHWSGKGDTNFSAGCQVIAGKSYINSDKQVVDCSKFASVSYNGLSNSKTRGAYNMLTDLILNYAPAGVSTVAYTLARDETFILSDDIDEQVIDGWVESMKKPK